MNAALYILQAQLMERLAQLGFALRTTVPHWAIWLVTGLRLRINGTTQWMGRIAPQVPSMPTPPWPTTWAKTARRPTPARAFKWSWPYWPNAARIAWLSGANKPGIYAPQGYAALLQAKGHTIGVSRTGLKAWIRTILKIIAVGAAAFFTAVAIVAYQIWQGYTAHNSQWWLDRIAARRMTALELGSGTLLTAVGYKGDVNYRDFGFLSAPPSLPKHYVDALLYLEDKHLLDEATTLRYAGGIDWPGVGVGAVSSRGGSNLVTQSAKNLLLPEVNRSNIKGHWLTKKAQSYELKLEEIGNAMRLRQALQGPPEAVIRLYAEVAPLML